MNKWVKGCIFTFVSLLCIQLVGPQISYADSNKKLDIRVIENSYFTEENLSFDNSESIVEKLGTDNTFIRLTSGELPSYYSSVDKGYVSAVKNQGGYGTCWAFSAIAAIESNLIKNNKAKQTIDLSETQLAYFTYHQPTYKYGNVHLDKLTNKSTDSYLNIGGNYYMATTTFAKGIGIASEGVMPYSQLNYTATYDNDLAFESDYIIKNSYFINMGDKVAVKNAVVKYGAVACTMYMSGWYLESNTNSYNQKDYNYSNHGVVIVGWDDNYSASNFTQKPKKNGAWLVRNSYGASWGNNGYFWVSYEEGSIPYSLGAVYEADINDGSYLHRYQYDGNPIYAYFMNVPYYSNVYTAESLEQIYEVGLMTMENNISYQMEIYTNVSKVPTDGVKVYDKKGVLPLEGYHTIKVDDVINVSKGEKFAIVITTRDASGGYVDVLVDMSSDFDCTFNYKNVSNLGESFSSYDKKYWQDLSSANNDTAGYNWRIKVLTKKCDFSFNVDKTNGYIVNKEAKISVVDGLEGAQYKYIIKNVATGETKTIDYGTNGLYSWIPTVVGEYDITMYMKDINNILGNGINKEYTLTKRLTIKSDLGISLTTRVNYDYNNYRVTITPTVTGNVGNKVYSYIIKDKNNVTVHEKTGVTDNTYYWAPPTGGTYTVYCTVEDGYNRVSSYKKVIVPVLSNAKMTASTQFVDNKMLLTINASASNGAGVIQYCYTIKNEYGTTIASRCYTIQNKYECQLTAAGKYVVYCTVKDSLGKSFQLVQDINVAGISGYNMSVIRKTVANRPVMSIVGSSTGGYGTRQYYYRIKKANGTVVAVKNYNHIANYDWYPTSGGTYYIEGYVKDALGSIKYRNVSCTVASLSINKISVEKKNVTKGLRLQIKPISSGAIGSTNYYYQVKNSKGKVMAQKNYSSSSYLEWYPTKSDTYYIVCNAKDSCGNIVSKQINYKVTKASIKIKKITYTKKKSGKKYKVTIKPSATGGYGKKSYQYQILNSKGKVITKKNYTTGTKVTLNVSKRGTYYIRVYTKDKWGTKVSKKIKVKI